MTAPKDRFARALLPHERRLYSLNLLLAGYEPIASLARDEELLARREPATRYGARDFAPHRFGKHVTTPLPLLGARGAPTSPGDGDGAGDDLQHPGALGVHAARCLV